MIPQIKAITGAISNVLGKIKGLRDDIQPGYADNLRQVQADVRAIKERLGIPLEALPIEDREMLVEIINKRIIEQRRERLVADMKESLEACRRGEVHTGTVDDLLKDLEEDLRE